MNNPLICVQEFELYVLNSERNNAIRCFFQKENSGNNIENGLGKAGRFLTEFFSFRHFLESHHSSLVT